MLAIRVLLAVCALALSGCLATAPQVVPVDVSFDQDEASRLIQPGKNTIKGSALLRQAGGGVVTCAGGSVWLFPATEYADRRMAAIYGTVNGGFNPVSRQIRFVPDIQSYTWLTKETRCDAQGAFVFDEVADGRFYVMTRIVWQVGAYVQTGGFLMQQIEVAGGQAKSLVLSH